MYLHGANYHMGYSDYRDEPKLKVRKEEKQERERENIRKKKDVDI